MLMYASRWQRPTRARLLQVTSDAWTDPLLRKYAAVTVHTTDTTVEPLQIRVDCVGVVPLHESSTWLYLSEQIVSRLGAALPATAKLTTIVTDGGANMVKAARAITTNSDNMYIDQLGPNDWDEPIAAEFEEEDIDSNIYGASFCLAHIAQRVVVKQLAADGSAPQSIVRLIDCVRGIVTTIRQSTELRAALVQAQRDLGLKVGRWVC